MAKFFAIACIMAAVGYVYIRTSADDLGPSRPAPAPAAAPAVEERPSSGVNGYMGKTGYLMEIPGDYEAYPSTQGAGELVFFYPRGGQPTMDEARYGQLRLVRLEVFPSVIEGKALPLPALKEGVARTLDQRGETYTLQDLNLGRPAFQATITKPKELKQVFVEGAGVIYQFTGADEELIYAMARSIKEGAELGVELKK